VLGPLAADQKELDHEGHSEEAEADRRVANPMTRRNYREFVGQISSEFE
jgi:hypothetical protein